MAGTVNSWNNQISGSYNQIILNAGVNGVAISTDASAASIDIGTGAAAKTITLGNTTSSSTTINAGTDYSVSIGSSTINTYAGANTTGSFIRLRKNRSGGVITTGDIIGTITVQGHDGTGYVNCGLLQWQSTGAIALNQIGTLFSIHTHPVSAAANPTQRMTIGAAGNVTINTPDSGVGLTISGGGLTVTTGAVSINSGTAAFDLSNDASATSVNVGTGGAAKTVIVGSTTTTSSLALKYGTNDFTLASATGTVMSALDTGEINYPLQPAFLAYLGSTDTNKTGAGTGFTIGAGTALTEVFDQNSDFNTNGTFTAPVTGRYFLSGQITYTGCTVASQFWARLNMSNREARYILNRGASAQDGIASVSGLFDMDAGDTCTLIAVAVGEAADTDDISGGATVVTYFSGYLAC